MTPLARDIVSAVAQELQLDLARILGRTRLGKYMHARIAIAQRLSGHGYSASRIGEVLNRDRTTVLFYLGRTAKRQPQPLKWKAPRVVYPKGCGDLKEAAGIGRPRAPRPNLYLVPYAGADPEYVWQRRERAKA